MEMAHTPTEDEKPVARSGRVLPLSERLDDFAAFVAGLVAPKLVSHWRDRLATRWAEEQASFTGKADSTIKLYGSKYRKAAKDAVEGYIDFAGGRSGDPSKAALMQAVIDMPDDRRAHVLAALPDLLASPKEILDRVHADYKKKVAARHRALAVVDEWEKLATTLRMMLRSTDPYEKTIGIAGCTGRRFREVLQTGVFGPVREDAGNARVTQRYALSFSGQLKTRGAPGTRHDETYIIPTIAPAKEVLAAINTLRQSPEGKEWAALSPETLNSRVNQALNKRLQTDRKIVGMWPPGIDLTVKSLRDFYAEVTYVAMGKVSESKGAFIARVLGHSAEDIETSLSYQKLALRGHDEAAMAALREMQAAAEAQRSARRAAGLPVADAVDEDEGAAEVDESDDALVAGLDEAAESAPAGTAEDEAAENPSVVQPKGRRRSAVKPAPTAGAKAAGKGRMAPAGAYQDNGEIIDPND